jgi:hypothetical protein
MNSAIGVDRDDILSNSKYGGTNYGDETFSGKNI